METPYSAYTRHCMRFYTRYPQPKFHSDVERQNWNACDQALQEFEEAEKELLVTLYRDYTTISHGVYKLSIDCNIKRNTIWKLINDLEYKIAKRRNMV